MRINGSGGGKSLSSNHYSLVTSHVPDNKVKFRNENNDKEVSSNDKNVISYHDIGFDVYFSAKIYFYLTNFVLHDSQRIFWCGLSENDYNLIGYDSSLLYKGYVHDLQSFNNTHE